MRKKVCGKCLKLKNITKFDRDGYHRNGSVSVCKECRKTYNRIRKRLIRENKWPPEQPIRIIPSPDDPDCVKLPPVPAPADRKTMRNSTIKVNKALAIGELVQPSKCSVCGQTSNVVGKLVAHHIDYTRPFDVVWLCKSCHMITHAAARGRGML